MIGVISPKRRRPPDGFDHHAACRFSSLVGAGDRARTGDSLLGKQVLYQLSYAREWIDRSSNRVNLLGQASCRSRALAELLTLLTLRIALVDVPLVEAAATGTAPR
jgi:hypothetical protein